MHLRLIRARIRNRNNKRNEQIIKKEEEEEKKKEKISNAKIKLIF